MSRSIFLCWSGDRSHGLARAVEALVKKVLKLKPSEVFVSDGIEKGVTWFPSIAAQLQRADAGIVCVTPENTESPWLHFEAGALAQRLGKERREDAREPAAPRPEDASSPPDRLFTLLHGFKSVALRGPLGAYQATTTTRTDMTEMFRSIASILGEPRHRGSKRPELVIDERHWKRFATTLEALTVPARTLVPDLEVLFQRKTFNEPLYRCVDKAWIRRYDGARETRDKLLAQLDRVRDACSAHERGLFEMVLAELNGYAMTIQSMLLRPMPFDLEASGDLKMEPGIKRSCEDRRLAIRSLAGRLLRPLDEPLQEAAVRFMGAETNEEREMIVHRLEGAIRREREVAFENVKQDARGRVTWRVIGRLTQKREPIRFRESSWDLDRIYFYLLVQYFGIAVLRWERVRKLSNAYSGSWKAGKAVPLRHDWLCACRDVIMEVERYHAKAKGGSLMPLTYALVALQEIRENKAPNPEEARAAMRSAFEAVETGLGAELVSEPGRAIDRALKRMRALDGPPRRLLSTATQVGDAKRAHGNRDVALADPGARSRVLRHGRRAH